MSHSSPDHSIVSDGITPTLAELIALRGTAQRRPAARRGRFGMTGQAPSPSRGRGMEYAESREYAIGDDARHIDWRLTARSGRPHTKLFQAERERLTLLVADTAPTLYFGTRARFKSVQAARAGAVAVWAAVREGDRVAAVRGSTATSGRGSAVVTPGNGARGALRVLDALVRWYAAPPADDAGLPVALDQAARLLRPGSRLLVLADPRSVDGIDAARWTGLTAHHEVVLLLLTDPLEQAPPKAALPFATSAGRLRLDLAVPAQRQRWNDEFLAPLQRAQQLLPARGVRLQVLASDAPSDAWLPLFGRMPLASAQAG